MDTPGFSSLYVNDFEKEDLKDYFREFKEFNYDCKFTGCVHINEPDCAIKDRLNRNEISQSRYDNYVLMYEEIKSKNKY